MKKNKFVVVFFLVMGLSVVGVVLFLGMKKVPKADVQITSVKEEIIENTIEISGNVEAANQQTLYAAGNGTVKKSFCFCWR